jgi:hypothetical protein
MFGFRILRFELQTFIFCGFGFGFLNRPPALYRLRVKAHTTTPVWAFLFAALRARSAIIGDFFCTHEVRVQGLGFGV